LLLPVCVSQCPTGRRLVFRFLGHSIESTSFQTYYSAMV
jgi:hypothetical protein